MSGCHHVDQFSALPDVSHRGGTSSCHDVESHDFLEQVASSDDELDWSDARHREGDISGAGADEVEKRRDVLVAKLDDGCLPGKIVEDGGDACLPRDVLFRAVENTGTRDGCGSRVDDGVDFEDETRTRMELNTFLIDKSQKLVVIHH